MHVRSDWVQVGRLEARAILAAKPRGNYVIVKGPPDDLYMDFVSRGISEVPQPAVDSGAVRIVDELTVTDWVEQTLQPGMDASLKKNHNRVDAVIVEGDALASYVAASLKAAGLEGKVALASDGGDPWRLNAVARGVQTVDVWQNAETFSRTLAETTVALCRNHRLARLSGAVPITLPSGRQVPSILIAPQAITRENLGVVIDAGWISKSDLCKDVEPAKAPPACK